MRYQIFYKIKNSLDKFRHLTSMQSAKDFYDDINEAYQRTNPPVGSPRSYDYEVKEVRE